MTRAITGLLLLALMTLHPVTASALLQKGEQLPEIVGETLDGQQFDSSSLKGKPFILKIGTTWCGTCSEQSKSIDELRDFMQENDIAFAELFIQESAKKVRKYFDKKKYQLPDQTILGDGTTSRKLNVYLIPRVLLIDKNHQVYRDGDAISKNNLKQQLEKMLAAN